MHKHLKPFILLGNYQKVVIIEDDAALNDTTTPNLQVNTVPIKEQETLGDEDVVDHKSNKEHEVLRDALQILVDVKVCDGSNITSCEHWSMHIRHGIHDQLGFVH